MSLIFLILSFLLPLPAWAQASGGSSSSLIIGMLLMFAVLFFLVILPQSRKAKKHQELINNLEKGDEVLLQSGMYGKIHGLADKVITLEIAPNVRVRVDKNYVANKTSEKAA